MRIGLVTPYDWAVPGGVNKHVSSLAEAFHRAGHETKIIAPCSRPISEDNDRLTIIGERCVGVPASGSVANISLAHDLSRKVSRLLEREQFDVIHMHEPFMPFLPLQFLRFSTTLNVATFHATREGGSRIYAYSRLIIEDYWQRLDGRIVVSPTALRTISRYFPGRYHILPNGIDYDHFASATEPVKHLRDGKRNILFVGRMEQRKGLQYLLQAFGDLKSESDDLRLIVVGPDGGMLPTCQRIVEDRKLADVVFVGPVDNSDLPRYYKTADIFCAANTGQESFGIVLLEAMAAGLPIVASDIAGFRHVLRNNEEGLLVPACDSTELAQAIRRLLGDEPLRHQMRQKGMERAKDFNWDRVAGQVLSHYQQLVTGKKH